MAKRTCASMILLIAVGGISARPAKYPGGWGHAGGGRLWGHTLSDLAARSVSPQASMPSERVISFVDSDRRYDVVISGDDPARLLRELLSTTFGVGARRESRRIDVLALVRAERGELRMTPAKARSRPDCRTWPVQLCRHGLAAWFPPPPRRTTHTFAHFGMAHLAAWLEGRGEKVVLDETNLPGAYDFVLVEDPPAGITIPRSLESIGLELRPARRDVEAIYVDVTRWPAKVRVEPVRNGYRRSGDTWPTTKSPMDRETSVPGSGAIDATRP